MSVKRVLAGALLVPAAAAAATLIATASASASTATLPTTAPPRIAAAAPDVAGKAAVPAVIGVAAVSFEGSSEAVGCEFEVGDAICEAAKPNSDAQFNATN